MLCLKKILGLNNIWVQKKFESIELWDEKKFQSKEKILVVKKKFGHKKSLDLKQFWLQGKFLSKNIGEEKLSPRQMLQGQMSL